MAKDIKQAIQSANVLSLDDRERLASVGAINKNLIVDVFDAYVYDSEGNLLMKSENLTEAGISSSMDQEEVRNGKGNKVFAIINKNKSMEVTLTENTFDFQALAYKNGTKVVKGNGVGSVGTQVLKATDSEGIKVTLAKAPLNNKVVSYCNGKAVEGAVSGTEVTYATGVTAGQMVTVEPYECAIETAEKIVIKASEFPQANRIILQTVELSPEMKHVANIYVVIDKATPDGAWELNTQSERQPSDSAVKFKVAVNDQDELATILREVVQ